METLFWILIGVLCLFQIGKILFFYHKKNFTKVAHAFVPILILLCIGFSACPFMGNYRPSYPTQKQALWYALDDITRNPSLIAFTEFEGKGGNNMGIYTFIRSHIFVSSQNQNYSQVIVEGYQQNDLAFNVLAQSNYPTTFVSTSQNSTQKYFVFEGDVYRQESKDKLLYNFSKIKGDYTLKTYLTNYQNGEFTQKTPLAEGKIGESELLKPKQTYSFGSETTFDLIWSQNDKGDKHMLVLRMDSGSSRIPYLVKNNKETIALFEQYNIKPSERVTAITTEVAQNLTNGEYTIEFRTNTDEETIRVSLEK